MLRLLCLLGLLSAALGAELLLKNLAGPPSDFALYTLPTPLQNADVQHSASFTVDLSPSSSAAHVLTQTLSLQVDSEKLFSFTFYSPNEKEMKLSLTDPKGHHVSLHGKKTYFPIGDYQVEGTDYKFKNPKHGTYTLTVETKSLTDSLYEELTSNTIPDAYVILWNEDALSTHTILNTYSLLTGSQVGLVTRVVNTTATSNMAPAALIGAVEAAVMNVVFPSGASTDVPMADDGLHNDEAANDGIFGALITASQAGQYVFSATVEGNNDGVAFVRTTQQLVTVVDPTLSLLGSATGMADTSQAQLILFINVDAPISAKYKAYAEVWGTDANGNEIPIAWVGGMTLVQVNAGVKSERRGAVNVLPLTLDLNWVNRAQAKAPLVLKNVMIQDPSTFVPIAQADEIPVKMPFSLDSFLVKMKPLLNTDEEITPEMLEGKMPTSLKTRAVNASAANDATLLLVHGYCSKVNPWQKSSDIFTNGQYFLSASQNYPHDSFAIKVIDWAETFGAFSYLGHSQGGAVGLHLKNYYWSGLDLVSGGRILQSVGTPYQGCSGAGSAADLLKLFGLSCGANQDLTKDGSSLWLTGITSANRALVYYYTTTYEQGKLFGDYCNLAVNLVLNWPNDGISEFDLAQLPGGQNQGNTESQCHSLDMKYPPQFEDRNRNKAMNAAAARQIKA